MPNQLGAYPPSLAQILSKRIEEKRQQRERLANEKVEQDLKAFGEFYRSQVQYDELNIETVQSGIASAFQLNKPNKILDALFRVADLYLLREALNSNTQREIFIRIIGALIQFKKSNAIEFFTAIMLRCQAKTFSAYDDYQMRKSIVETARILGVEKAMKAAFDQYKWQVKTSSTSINPEWLKLSAIEAKSYLDSLRDRKAALSGQQNDSSHSPKESASPLGFGAALGISDGSNNNN